MRYLANAVIHQDRVYRNAIVEILHDGTLSLQPFDGEQHSTTFIPGIILVAADSAVDDTTAASLKTAVAHASLLERAIHIVRRRASHLALYATPDDSPTLILLPRR